MIFNVDYKKSITGSEITSLIYISQVQSQMVTMYLSAELEIAVSHWPFSDQFGSYSRTNLLYISNGESNDDVPTLNEWPTHFNPYVSSSVNVSMSKR